MPKYVDVAKIRITADKFIDDVGKDTLISLRDFTMAIAQTKGEDVIPRRQISDLYAKMLQRYTELVNMYGEHDQYVQGYNELLERFEEEFIDKEIGNGK